MSSANSSLDALRIDRSAIPAARSSGGLWFVLIVLALAGAGAAWWFLSPTSIEVQTIAVREQISGNGGTKTLLNASGYVTARRAATVSSKVTGKVMVTLVEEGKAVKEGQILANLDASNVQANLRLAEARADSAKKIIEETRPNLVFALQEVERFTDLVRSKAASQSDYNRAEAQGKVLQATLARQQADLVVAEREVAQWKQQVDDTIIRAPFSGIVISKNAQPGEMISPMSSGGFTRTGICTIVDMKSLEIDVDVSESYINRVKPGLPVQATLDSYADLQIPAKVIAIIPTAERQKATVKVRVGFDKLDPRILPDMGVKVAFQSAAEESTKPTTHTYSVPKSAVLQDKGRDIVWVVRDGKIERRAVTVSQTTADESTIATGLNSGETVVINAPNGLADGSRVKEKKS